MQTSELQGHALDWAVDKAEGGSAPTNPEHLRSYLLSLDEDARWDTLCKYTPGDIDTDIMSHADMIEYGLITWRCPPVSTDWAHGGPIIERERIEFWTADSYQDEYGKFTSIKSAKHPASMQHYKGPTPLIAAMRCYVASKLGDTVDIPEELT